MFDVDGDGLISYSEYLLLITFLSIPVEVTSAVLPDTYCVIVLPSTCYFGRIEEQTGVQLHAITHRQINKQCLTSQPLSKTTKAY